MKISAPSSFLAHAAGTATPATSAMTTVVVSQILTCFIVFSSIRAPLEFVEPSECTPGVSHKERLVCFQWG